MTSRQRHAALAQAEHAAAERALADAKILLAHKRYEGAVSRGYYAIFHAARAALYRQRSNPVTHRGTVSEFSRLLVKSKKIDKKLDDILRQARDERQVADYESGEKEFLADQTTARAIVGNAKLFLKEIKKFLE